MATTGHASAKGDWDLGLGLPSNFCSIAADRQPDLQAVGRLG
jgi:hypothetical protein